MSQCNRKTAVNENSSSTVKTPSSGNFPIPDILYLILRSLSTNQDLHSCLLVNKSWASLVVPILWEAPFRNDYSFIPSPKVINTYIAFLPEDEQKSRGIKLSTSRLPFDYPSYLEELPFDRFCNAVSGSSYYMDQEIIINLLKMFAKRGVRLQKFDICSTLANQYILNKDWVVLPRHPELASMFGDNLSHFSCGFQWSINKVRFFDALTEKCHNIKNLSVKVWREDEGIALANLIHAQKRLKKFSLLNSNHFASIVIQALRSQSRFLDSLSFEHMHNNHNLDGSPNFFEYTKCQLNEKAIDSLVKCVNITKLKITQCDEFDSPIYLPIVSAFTKLRSLKYHYGGCKNFDYSTPFKLLSGLVRTSFNTLEKINIYWNNPNLIDITQLIQAISLCTNLKRLRISLLYTSEQLALIHRSCNKLKYLEIYIRKISHETKRTLSMLYSKLKIREFNY
jgi:hypothetical protein